MLTEAQGQIRDAVRQFAQRELAAAQSVGMARAAYEAALAYARQRETFGRPIIEHQAVSFRLADMATTCQAAKLMVLHAAGLTSDIQRIVIARELTR